MLEKNLGQRLGIIGLVLAVAAFLLAFNPLRPGNDIAGGVAMIFEIDDTGIEDPNLAEEMKRQLQRRVDPSGVYDLIWRVHGRNRIEVQMPLPPKEASALRDTYAQAIDDLYATNVTRGEINAALAKSGAEREAAIDELAVGIEARQERLQTAAEKFDEYQAARGAAQAAEAAGDGEAATDDEVAAAAEELQLAVRDAEEEYADAVDRVLATNLPTSQFEGVLERTVGSQARTEQLNELRERFPALAEQINEVVAAHDAWAAYGPTLDGPADLKRKVMGTGVLSFRILPQISTENPTAFEALQQRLADRGPAFANTQNYRWFELDDPVSFLGVDSLEQLNEAEPRDFVERGAVVGRHADTWYVLAHDDPEHSMVGDRDKNWELRNVGMGTDELGRPAVQFGFNNIGSGRFSEMTGKFVGRLMAICLDDTCISAPVINQRIDGLVTVEGDFGATKARYMIDTMNAGALPARLKPTPISERTLGSALGQTNLQKALYAGLVGLAVVVVIMVLFYRLFGVIASLAVILNVVLVLAALSLLNARITLAGIAGIILTIGMSVDANVLIFERMREEKLRGSSLRMIIKNGYDKAFSTIIDANITTLLTCVILFYVGSEEVKGFGLTLGWGIVISLFTALFVTKTVFGVLLKYRLIKGTSMTGIIGVPKIDWYSERKIFLPISLILIVGGTGLLFQRGRDALDVEFRGGVSAEFALYEPIGYEQIRDSMQTTANTTADDADRLANATVSPAPGEAGAFLVRLPDVPADRLAALVAEPLEEAGLLARDGVETPAPEGQVLVRTRGEVTGEELQRFVRLLVAEAPTIRSGLGNANISAVLEAEDGIETGTVWSIATTETNKRLVEYVLQSAMGRNLERRGQIDSVLDGAFPVRSNRLGETVPNVPDAAAAINVAAHLDGVALPFRALDPPISVEEFRQRLREMRLQPDYQDQPWREFELIGMEPTGALNGDGQATYSSIVVLVSDPTLAWSTAPDAWETQFADVEAEIASNALLSEQALRKVSQFKSQISNQSAQDAILALALSWVMIIAYLWLRFGKVWYGVGGVAALIHDVFIALAAVGVSGWLGGAEHPIGNFFLINDFHIDMTIVAAFLTIIGYSINDTIVVFDRIRETRGRLGVVTPEIINSSINQCLSRTIMTTLTTLAVLLTMYIFGGASIRGFNYCMIVGILTGTYSSIAVAAPLLMLGMRREDVRRVRASATPA